MFLKNFLERKFLWNFKGFKIENFNHRYSWFLPFSSHVELHLVQFVWELLSEAVLLFLSLCLSFLCATKFIACVIPFLRRTWESFPAMEFEINKFSVIWVISSTLFLVRISSWNHNGSGENPNSAEFVFLSIQEISSFSGFGIKWLLSFP